MPKTPEEATAKDALYPDDLPGKALEIVEYAYYDADDDSDADHLPDDARYGWWLPVSEVGVEDSDIWAAAPRDLREALIDVDAAEGDAFRVIEVDKGPKDHDPYQVEIEYPYRP